MESAQAKILYNEQVAQGYYRLGLGWKTLKGRGTAAFVGAFVALAFLGPLLVMLLKGNESAYVRRQAVEVLEMVRER